MLVYTKLYLRNWAKKKIEFERNHIEKSKIYLHICIVLNISSKPLTALFENQVVSEGIYSKVALATGRWIFQLSQLNFSFTHLL